MNRTLLFFLLLSFRLLGVSQNLPAVPEGAEWSPNLLLNADLSTSDFSSFACKGDGTSMTIVNKDGKRAIEALSGSYNGNSWDSQFFIVIPEPLQEGDQIFFRMSYMADSYYRCYTQGHSSPGNYNSWLPFGELQFTTSWNTQSWEKTVSADEAKNGGWGAIAFDLTTDGVGGRKFYFSDLTLCKLQPKSGDCTKLVINEVQVSNNDLFIDPSYNYGAWMEVYNADDEPVSLANLYVSDDPANLRKFHMPLSAGMVPAHGVRNIWFDHNAQDGSYSNNAQSQVRFKLNPEGGTLYLSDPDGNLLQSVTYPASTPRCSYARLTDGGAEWGTTGTPTPEASNNGISFATERLAAPVVSRDGGLFDTGQSVSFQVTIPTGATLRYTTDGSTPTATNGSRSTTGRFTVNATAVYRFCLVQDGKLPSPVVTRSFIFRNHDYYLPVLSIATKPDNLFDHTIGVYVEGTNGSNQIGPGDYRNWYRDWERPANVEYFVPQQNSEGATSYMAMLNQETGFQVCGGWSRANYSGWVDGFHWETKSSFRLKTSKTFDGENELPYAVFPSKPYNKYKAWQVRNGGNDAWSRTKDPILQQIVLSSGIDVDCQDYQPCHVFFNGKYLGMLNIREASNKQYGYSNFGIDTDDMDQFENWGVLKVGDRQAWEELLRRARVLASSRDARDYEAVKELLDVDEYTNYMALQCYFGGWDWTPNSNNVKWYRSRSDGGKFRFVMFDVDSALEGTQNGVDYDVSMFSRLMDYSVPGGEISDLLRLLCQYEPFCRQFLDAMCLVEGSVLVPSRAREIAQRICDNTRTALSFENLTPTDKVTDELTKRYKNNVVTNVAQDGIYGLYDPYWLKLSSNIESGQLLLNGQRVPTGKFDGRAYNYRDYGIHLTAQAPAGYRFLGWASSGSKDEADGTVSVLLDNGSSWDYYDQGSMDAYAWKAPNFNASQFGWKMGYPAPFGYGNAGTPPQENSRTKLDYGSDAQNKRPTYYLRTTFYVDRKPSDDDIYRLNYQVDDGFAFYVNGKYINGLRVSQENARYDFVTNDYAGWEPDQGSFDIPASAIHQGENSLAVEIHNNSYTSSDMFWDCNLQRISFDDASGSFVSTSPTFCLSDKTAGTYNLVATYEKIADTKQRLEAGGSPVRINEVSAANDIYINDYHRKNDWVELYNTTDEDIDLTGLYLSDNAQKPQKWQISGTVANTILPAHGTRIVWCDELEPISQLHAPFKLDNADGATVSIQAADGTWADQMTYLSQPRWQTYGRYPDGGNFTSLLNVPTIDKSNQFGLLDGYASYDPTEDGETAITLALAKGWNWTSHNLSEDVSFSRFNAYAMEARSQTRQSVLDAVLGWQGDLKVIDHTQGYKLNMKQTADVTLRGHLYDTSVPVQLQRGWNWVGIPLKNATALTAALKNYVPTSGDQVVGQQGFVTYESGTWKGTLTQLEPGQAYLFKVGQAQQLKWNDLSQGSRVRQRRYESSRRDDTAPWTLDIHAHPNVMTMVAQLEADELDLSAGYCLGAFCEDECRGIAKLDDGLLYMNIHGEGGEDIQFRLLDAEGNQYAARERASMANLQSLGSPAVPYLLHVGRCDMEDVIRDATASPARVVSVQYYNLSGQRISQPQGVCVQRVILADGTVRVKKLGL